MTKTAAATLVAACLAAPTATDGSLAAAVRHDRGTDRPTEGPCGGAVPDGCTVFTVAKGDRVFFGGNDDYVNSDSYYWVAANLGLGGISAVAAPLVTACPILPFSPSMLATWWATVALGAPAGVLPLLTYESWAVRRGFRAWSILASEGDDVVTPPWRRLWWWIPLSYVVLVGWFAAGVLVQRLLSA